MSENIKEVSTLKQYEEDMVRYSIVVNRRRSIPEVRDGLKVVQRRILYDMLENGVTTFENRKKSAKVVGDTMGVYHPHGDSSIYTTMVPLANWFTCKMPLLRGKGNWGNIMGDGAAAMRYTEIALSQFGFDVLLSEIRENKNVVDWIPNFDRTTKEPEFLPCKIPLLLVNGSSGMGVGLSIDISTHNVVEVIQATRALIRNPKAKVILIPDHCQPCTIIGKDWDKISESGRGSYLVRGTIETGVYKKEPALFIKSLPNGVFVESVIEEISKLVVNKQLPMIKEITDQSSDTVELVIRLKRDADPNYVKEVLYAKTNIQKSFRINFEVVNGINHQRMNYKEYLLSFLDFRARTKFRLYCNKLQVCLTRHHRVSAYIRLLETGDIDDTIKKIRKQKTKDPDELMEFLIKKYNLTDLQAKYILRTNIMELSDGYLKQYKEEVAKLEEEIHFYETAITDNSGKVILNIIDKELADIQKKYGTPRTCAIMDNADMNQIPKGTFKVVITERNFIRKLPDSDNVGTVRRDHPKFVLRVENTENILLFDNKGKVFKFPVHKIPVTDKSSPGTDIRILIKNLTANIIAMYYEPVIKKIVEGSRKHYLTVVTKMNFIKRLDLEDFVSVNASGLIYSKIVDGDEVTDIVVTPTNLDVVVYSEHKALRIKTNKVPLFKRNAVGSKAMNTNDPIGGLSVIYPDAEYIVVITKSGKINRFNVSGLTVSDRAKAGSQVIKLDAGDSIFSIYGVNEKDHIRVVTSEEVFDIPITEVKLFSSVAKGTKMINTKSSNIIRTDIMKG